MATGWLVLFFPLYARVIWAHLLSNYIKDIRLWVFDGSCYKCHMLTGQKESYMKVLWWEFTLQDDWVSFRISHHSAEGWGGRTQASESSRRTGDDCSQEVSVGPCRCCRGSWEKSDASQRVGRVEAVFFVSSQLHWLSVFSPSWSGCFSTFAPVFLSCLSAATSEELSHHLLWPLEDLWSRSKKKNLHEQFSEVCRKTVKCARVTAC